MSVDIPEQTRALEAARKLKGEEKRQELKKIRALAITYLEGCARDFGVPYDCVLRAKALLADVDTALKKAKGSWAKIE